MLWLKDYLKFSWDKVKHVHVVVHPEDGPCDDEDDTANKQNHIYRCKPALKMANTSSCSDLNETFEYLEFSNSWGIKTQRRSW